MFTKMAFVQGYLKGMEKRSGAITSALGTLGTMGLIGAVGAPILGGVTTGSLHGMMEDDDYTVEAEKLLSKRKLNIIRERNKQLEKEIAQLAKKRGIESGI